ncbi:class I SAM-dependent methyltransferase [Streptomyces purpureus]|uniref:SAM-dependent methyltransferase n=1 Tax=Streptomyces purpureus TaxID=1951 RepID=A0A918LVQ5_9ACTN|nr:class I SAM-dependent methyltransferase [Streptomyces purpureus]GGT56624.1 SAM-dependent methyltransferase [Streptomyces purpureus]
MSHHHHHDDTQIDWNELSTLLETGAELQAPLYTQAASWLGTLVPAAGVRRILDVGSGPGVLTCLLAKAFPYAEVVAVDAEQPLLKQAARRAERAGLGDRVSVRHAELPAAIDDLGEADLVWAGNSLHHLGDQRAALSAFTRLLRPGGLLAVVEGGLPARHLPRTIGIGRPGLEARLDAVHADWFTDMRAELPGHTEETEDWRALLTAAGVTPSGTRTFLLDVPAPLPAVVRDHVVAGFTRRRTVLADRLAADDLATLDRLLDPRDPQSLHRRPDVYYATAHTVHTARRG